MPERTMTAMYDTRGAADTAKDSLVALGIPTADIAIHGTEAGATSTGTVSGERGFWGNIADALFPEEDRDTYVEGVRRGGYLLSVRVPEGQEELASEALESADPIDLDERSESWRRSGWQGQGAGSLDRGGLAATGDAVSGLAEVPGAHAERDLHVGTTAAATAGTATGSSALAAGTARADARNVGTQDETISLIEEQVRIGKREVGRGSVKVRSYVVETPVEEQINLRQERVTVERVAVDRAVEAGDTAFEERTIEAVERGEEAVVDKRARVTGEVRVRKDVDERTETVRDTARKTEVEVDDDRSGHAVETTATTPRRAVGVP